VLPPWLHCVVDGLDYCFQKLVRRVWLIEEVLKESVDAIIFSGDLFDSALEVLEDPIESMRPNTYINHYKLVKVINITPSITIILYA